MRAIAAGGILRLMQSRELVPIIHTSGRVEVAEVDADALQITINRAAPAIAGSSCDPQPVVEEAVLFLPYFVNDPARGIMQRAFIEKGAEIKGAGALVIAWAAGYQTAAKWGRGITA